MLMTPYVERTCTVVGGRRKGKSAPLEDYREYDAYVLLGEPGSGKTRSFQEEAQQTEAGVYVEAHDFVKPHRLDEWRGKILFIDALDELRAVSPSPEPLGQILEKLDQLERPRFRLSCRDADWYGSEDRDDLAELSKKGQITTLKIDPLSDDRVREFLATLEVDDVDAFMDTATEDGIAPLLGNPLTLELLAGVFADGSRPQSRKEAFEASCRSLVREHNRRHKRGRKPSGTDAQLDTAGYLCAVALLSGKRGYVRHATETSSHWIPFEDVADSSEAFNSVLRTRLFESSTVDHFVPLHKHVAEFLAGRYLASRVGADLPAARATALMTGFDGRVASPLRGVWAWFAANCAVARAELIDGDPLGVVLYGDVKQFSVDDKRRLLERVRGHIEDYVAHIPADWHSPRWADMATKDAAELIHAVFSTAPASEAGQEVALLLADAPQRQTFPGLKRLLLSIVRNESLLIFTRHNALHSLIRQFQDDDALADLDHLLTDVGTGRLADGDDELAGSLLCGLYPQRRSLADVKGFFHLPENLNLSGTFQYFWTTVVHTKANSSERAEAKGLSERFQQMMTQVRNASDEMGGII